MTDGEGQVGGERIEGSGHQKACGVAQEEPGGSSTSETLPRSGRRCHERQRMATGSAGEEFGEEEAQEAAPGSLGNPGGARF